MQPSATRVTLCIRKLILQSGVFNIQYTIKKGVTAEPHLFM